MVSRDQRSHRYDVARYYVLLLLDYNVQTSIMSIVYMIRQKLTIT